MPAFTYTGRANRLVLAGRTLVRGRLVELDGRAADAAAAHPDVVEGVPKSKAPETVELAALDDAPQTGTELRATLAGATKAQLIEFAEEREIDLESLGKRPNNADLVEAIATAIEAEAGS
jgi:hypothetical protein